MGILVLGAEVHPGTVGRALDILPVRNPRRLSTIARRRRYTMVENWSADVKKSVPDANEKAIAGIVKYCGIALQKRDSLLVAHGRGGSCARAQ